MLITFLCEDRYVCRSQLAFLDSWEKFISHRVSSNFSPLPLPLLIHLPASHGHLFQVSEHSADSQPHKRWLVSTGTRIYFISFFLPSGFVSASATAAPSLVVNGSMRVSSHRCSDCCGGQRTISVQIVPHKAESRWHSCWLCERPVCWPLRWGWHCQLLLEAASCGSQTLWSSMPGHCSASSSLLLFDVWWRTHFFFFSRM